MSFNIYLYVDWSIYSNMYNKDGYFYSYTFVTLHTQYICNYMLILIIKNADDKKCVAAFCFYCLFVTKKICANAWRVTKKDAKNV